jgi:hypothetical protein
LTAPASQQSEKDGSLTLRWQVAAELVATNIPVSDKHRRAKISQMKLQADQQLTDIAGAVLTVESFIAHGVTLTDPVTGEIREAIRIVLRLDDGSTVSTCSEPFMRSFAPLAQDFGPGDWEPPLKIVTKKIKGKVQGHYLVCHEYYEEAPKKATVKQSGKRD